VVRVHIGNGVRLHFDVTGTSLHVEGGVVRQKPTLLVLHGGPGLDHTSMRPWFDRFADVAQVVWYDHRGQGRSDGWDDPSSWNLDTWADDVVRFCDALGIPSPVVLGLSFGGMVAMHYASRHPEHPSKLVLMSSSARPDVDRIVETFRRLHGDDVAEVAQAFWSNPDEHRLRYREICMPLYSVHRHPTSATSIMNPKVMRRFLGQWDEVDLLSGLGSVTCDTLVLAGQQDPACPIEDALDIVAALPTELTQFERLDPCGHGTHRDQPEATEAILRRFLAGDRFVRDARPEPIADDTN